MENNLSEIIHTILRLWKVSITIGLLSLVLSIIFIFHTLDIMITLNYLFVTGFFIAAIFEIVVALINKNSVPGWVWILTSGIINMLLGVVLILIPTSTPWIIIYFIGFWIMLQSITAIDISSNLKKRGIRIWDWLLVLIISGIFLLLVFIEPSEFAVVTGAFAFIAYNIFRIYLSIKFKLLRNKMDN